MFQQLSTDFDRITALIRGGVHSRRSFDFSNLDVVNSESSPSSARSYSKSSDPATGDTIITLSHGSKTDTIRVPKGYYIYSVFCDRVVGCPEGYVHDGVTYVPDKRCKPFFPDCDYVPTYQRPSDYHPPPSSDHSDYGRCLQYPPKLADSAVEHWQLNPCKYRKYEQNVMKYVDRCNNLGGNKYGNCTSPSLLIYH